jgi:hypothetical protein
MVRRSNCTISIRQIYCFRTVIADDANSARSISSLPTSSANVQKKGSKGKQAQATSKRVHEDHQEYSPDVSDPTSPAKTRESYTTAIAELKIDRSDQTAFHVLKGEANAFLFADVSKRDSRPMSGQTIDMIKKMSDIIQSRDCECQGERTSLNQIWVALARRQCFFVLFCSLPLSKTNLIPELQKIMLM